MEEQGEQRQGRNFEGKQKSLDFGYVHGNVTSDTSNMNLVGLEEICLFVTFLEAIGPFWAYSQYSAIRYEFSLVTTVAVQRVWSMKKV